ncbi:hypothetical protein DPEC_G00272410 [Dallia pectoralis]|uniref:Uncharacterized protein n=1 Tax=Dallia pectoralis TaxID=75939 RepID=A0ACC2FQD7_DALPE|nr:hypothetical protein DPEC_G00272410 [Dallia pectoralis]
MKRSALEPPVSSKDRATGVVERKSKCQTFPACAVTFFLLFPHSGPAVARHVPETPDSLQKAQPLTALHCGLWWSTFVSDRGGLTTLPRVHETPKASPPWSPPRLPPQEHIRHSPALPCTQASPLSHPLTCPPVTPVQSFQGRISIPDHEPVLNVCPENRTQGRDKEAASERSTRGCRSGSPAAIEERGLFGMTKCPGYPVGMPTKTRGRDGCHVTKENLG